MAKALVRQGARFEIWHTRECLVLQGEMHPRPEPLQTAGQSWPPGTVFDRLGSKNTCSGYVTLGFGDQDGVDYGGLLYVGIVRCSDGEFACFKAGEKPAGGYFAWHPTKYGLMWGTNSCAGRVISMDDVIVRGEEVRPM